MQKRRSKKYKKIFFCLFFSIVIVLAGFQVSAEELNDTQKEVWKTVENCWENFTKSDLNAVMAGIHADSLEWWATKPIPLNKKGMEPSYKAFLSSKPETY